MKDEIRSFAISPLSRPTFGRCPERVRVRALMSLIGDYVRVLLC
jgi:hypothetical protein